MSYTPEQWDKKIDEWQEKARARKDATRPVSTLDTQYGGSHYKDMALQPWEVIDSMYPGRASAPFYIGTAIAYFMRWEAKGGLLDIQKGIHTLEHFIEQVKIHEANELEKA